MAESTQIEALGERVRELLPPPREHEREERRADQRPHDRDRRTVALPNPRNPASHATGQLARPRASAPIGSPLTWQR